MPIPKVADGDKATELTIGSRLLASILMWLGGSLLQFAVLLIDWKLPFKHQPMAWNQVRDSGLVVAVFSLLFTPWLAWFVPPRFAVPGLMLSAASSILWINVGMNRTFGREFDNWATALIFTSLPLISVFAGSIGKNRSVAMAIRIGKWLRSEVSFS